MDQVIKSINLRSEIKNLEKNSEILVRKPKKTGNLYQKIQKSESGNPKIRKSKAGNPEI